MMNPVFGTPEYGFLKLDTVKERLSPFVTLVTDRTFVNVSL